MSVLRVCLTTQALSKYVKNADKCLQPKIVHRKQHEQQQTTPKAYQDSHVNNATHENVTYLSSV